MDFQHDENDRSGRFSTGEAGLRAELTYSPGASENSVVFDHTFVPPQLRGKGVAEALVDHAVDHARSKGQTVVPACSYVRALFQRHPEKYGDVIADTARPFGGL